MANTWLITQKPSFINDFVELSKETQRAASRAMTDLEQAPTTLRGNTIKKLAGFRNVYRYRLGDFRMVYAAEEQAQAVQLLAIGPRGSIYQRFNFNGWDAPDKALVFGPELAASPEWTQHPEWFQPQEQGPAEDRLPRKLTPSLLKRWHIDTRYHNVLMRCLTADDLVNISEERVPQTVLARVLEGLYPATAFQLAGQPDLVLFDPEDLLRYAEGDLTGFLLRLDEKQAALTSWALSGPTLVKGGPGSGKSTVALYRLRALIAHHQKQNDEVPKVLFTTYTRALANFSQSLLNSLLRDVLPAVPEPILSSQIRINTLHSEARRIVADSRKELRIATPSQQREALRAARTALQPRGLGDADKIAFAMAIQDLADTYLLDEFTWVIEGQDCQNEAAYQAAVRSGRGVPFTAGRRTAVWQLYETYRDYLQNQGLSTWGSLIQDALAQVESGAFKKRWDYIVVDEAQDLPPAALALAIELCRDPAGLFLTADANQSLYNRGFRWRHVHSALNISGRTRILRRNYRSTKQIAAAAAEILAADPSHDGEALEQEFVHSGPMPVLHGAGSNADQWQWIAQQIFDSACQLRLPVNAATVLVPSRTVGEPLADALSEHGLPAKFMNSHSFDLEEPCIKVTTLHAAKGLEFPIAVIANIDAGRLPREIPFASEEELAAYLSDQRRLLFVGCTRAMRHLFVTYDRNLPSPFIRTLSEGNWHHAAD